MLEAVGTVLDSQLGLTSLEAGAVSSGGVSLMLALSARPGVAGVKEIQP